MDFSLKGLIEIILGLVMAGGLSFHLIRQHCTKIQNKSQVQNNGMFSKNNNQIGEIHVKK